MVILTKGAGTTVRDTSWCGQTFFPTLTAASDYALEVAAPGYVTNRIDPITVNGITVQEVILVAS